jgi:hypothetical protein
MDPRLEAVDPKRTKLTPLMWAKSRALSGAKVNACPFGCTPSHLDENGYCRHLVGFTNDGQFYEPMIRGTDGRRVVRCKMEEDPDLSVPGEEKVLRPIRLAVEEGDQLVPISASSRVYRQNVPNVTESKRQKAAAV